MTPTTADYARLGIAIFNAMAVTHGYGHTTSAGVGDYVPHDPDAGWHASVVRDYLAMANDPEASERFHEFWQESRMGRRIASAVMF